jgi:1-acyl-sn-glycerol-3-phosphate acyltransferase
MPARRARAKPKRTLDVPVARRLGLKIVHPPGVVDEEFIRKVLVPYKLIRHYCRVTVEGIENVPGRGPALIAANHTGWLGLDYANLAMTIHDSTGRVPRGVVHPLWFKTRKVSDAAGRIGLVPADKDLMVSLLKKGKLVIIFPEAEQGAFKTVEEGHYRLLEFKRGFVRVAMAAGVPILPVAIIGGEEANPLLSRLTLTDKVFRLPLVRPRNLLPKPVKWRISFLPPVPMKRYRAKDASDRALVHKIADRVRTQIQDELEVQLEKRGHKYF